MAIESRAERAPSNPEALVDWQSRDVIEVFVVEILVVATSVSFYWSTREKWPHHSRENRVR